MSLADEFGFVSLTESNADGQPRLLEQWELVISLQPSVRTQLLLWAVSSPAPDWASLHISFCRRALEDELINGFWNQFASSELRALGKNENEYWAPRCFLERAVREGTLPFDARTPEDKSKLQRPGKSKFDPGVPIGHTITALDIIALVDSAQSLNNFEYQRQNGGQR
jgi:hypothetical protein